MRNVSNIRKKKEKMHKTTKRKFTLERCLQ